MDNKDEANQKRDRVLGIIDEIVKMASGGEYIYRGQPDAAYPHVSSTLYRDMEKSCPEIKSADWLNVNLVQEKALEAARKFASEDCDKSDKEMLSRIQHYSGDTNLIDFTKDYRVALFFACSQKGGVEGGKDGKVFLLKTSNLKDSEKGNEVEIVNPVHPFNRVEAQNSVFVQSRTGVIPDGMMEFVVEIPLNLKQSIMDYLKSHHGISEYSIYNDLHGYIRNREAHGNSVREFYLGLTYGYKSDKAQSLKEQDDALKKAIERFDKAIRLDPNFAMAYINRGVAKQKSDDVPGAISDCDKAIALAPNDAAAYNNRGNAKWKLGDLSGAMSDYDKSIELDPDYVGAYNNRGNAKRELGDLSGAISDYDKAIALAPGDAEVYANRGVAKWELGDASGARSDYDKSIELAPNNAAAYNNRGNAKWKLGDLSGAMSDYDKSIELDPDYVDAYNNRGISKRELGDLSGAMSDYDKSIELDPDYVGAYNNRGNAKRELGDLSGAISDYDKAIALAPGDAEVYNNRGNAKRESKDNESAIKDFNIAIDLNPSFAEAYLNRGIAFANLQNFQQALLDWKNAKELALQKNKQNVVGVAQKNIERVTAKMSKS